MLRCTLSCGFNRLRRDFAEQQGHEPLRIQHHDHGIAWVRDLDYTFDQA
jgi:hypothetical protein